jgi:two-component system OmpR family sensor kinase
MRPAGVRHVRPMPIRVRLVAGFVLTMMAVLAASGTVVYWRIAHVLDSSVDDRLTSQTALLKRVLHRQTIVPGPPLDELRAAHSLDQLVDGSGSLLAVGSRAPDHSLLSADDLASALRGPIRRETRVVLPEGERHVRLSAFPVANVSLGSGQRLVAVTFVRLRNNDEALKALLVQLILANVAALALASLVGYRLARRSLAPVEQYRAQADEIAAGATGVRLQVEAVDDEISRLGHTLNRMLLAQERAAQQQRQFISDASHELRGPLTLVSSEIELALRRPRTPAQHEAILRRVADGTARLIELADQLLSLEQATHASASLTTLLVAADVTAAVQRAGRRATSHVAGARVVAVSATAPLTVLATEGQLDQMLGNLVDNAVTHGAGTILVGAFRTDPALLLAVTDDGSGMPSDFLPEAIERFRRADAARSRPGSGLGLALVQAIATGLGGELRLCSRGFHYSYSPSRFGSIKCTHPHTGTTATVVLPLAGG